MDAQPKPSPPPLTAAAVRAAIARTLQRIAPEVDLSDIPDTANLRRELDLDSVDFQNFVIGLSRELSIAVPESAAARLGTLAGCLEFFQAVRTQSL